MATLYQKRTAAKRASSSITRLIDQYQKNVKSLTGEYETAFANYQKRTAESMAPYEARVAEYKSTILPEYERQAAAYNQRIADYQRMIADYQPSMDRYDQSFYEGGPYLGQWGEETIGKNFKNSGYYTLDVADFGITARKPIEIARGQVREIQEEALGATGPFMMTKTVVRDPSTGQEYTFDPEYINPDAGGVRPYFSVQPDPNTVITREGTILRFQAEPGDIAPFTEAPPKLPTFPEPPEQVEDFDTTQFDAKRKQLEVELSREIGERKAARRSAVSRRTSRPLLQGA